MPLRIADTVMLLRTSTLAMAIRYAAWNECAVASLSMGGWPSQAWADAVDEAYECAMRISETAFTPLRAMAAPIATIEIEMMRKRRV